MADWKETARRLVACEQWEWKVGMLALEPLTGSRAVPARVCEDCFSDDPQTQYDWIDETLFPDLTDDATAGVLLGVISEITHGAGVRQSGPYWVCAWGFGGESDECDHAGHAIALAILEAWGESS